MPRPIDESTVRIWPRAWRLSTDFEPRNLNAYVPSHWPSKATWYAARAHVAESLNRAVLPEIEQMGLQENRTPTPDNNRYARPNLDDINADSTERLLRERGSSIAEMQQDFLERMFGGAE
jgi:hypothetical protein